MYHKVVDYIAKSWVSVAVQIFLTFLTFILIRYKYRISSSQIYLSKKTFKRLLEMFKSAPIVDNIVIPYEFKNVKANFSNYDVFNLGRRYKEEIKSIIKEYGVGTCGPRGFYGTIDVHLELEEKIAKAMGKENAIIYSNYFTCVQSVITSFCKSLNNVFVDKRASEAIKRGLSLSRCKVYEYDSLEDLEKKLQQPFSDKYVICERIGKNTGELLDMNKLIEMKNKYRFRIILDESYTIPFMYQTPNDRELYDSVELIIGSLSHGYPTNGGFCVGCKEAIDYQRLAGSAYVFSASLPAYISKAALCMLDEKLDYSKIKEKIELAFKWIPGIISPSDSPILIIEAPDISVKIQELRDEGYVIGKNGEYIRICLNENTNEADLRRVGEILKNTK